MHLGQLLLLCCSLLPSFAAMAAPQTLQQQAPFTDRLPLSVDPDAEPFTFNYSTSEACDMNWIGLYRASGGGPVNQTFVEPSLLWAYAPHKHGSVHLAVDKMLNPLEPGEYLVFFLNDNGYRWLAEPIAVTLQKRHESPRNLRFPLKDIVLHNARQHEPYSARIDGLIFGAGDSTVSFEAVTGDSWIDVAPNGGFITGVPGFDAPPLSHVLIRAKAGNDEAVASVHLSIPVRREWEVLVPEIKILSFNLWFGGTQVCQHLI